MLLWCAAFPAFETAMTSRTGSSVRLATARRWHAGLQRLHVLLGGRFWFPHVPLAILLGVGGIALLEWGTGAH